MRKPLDTYHYHEVIHTCHLINALIDDALLSHPAILQHKESIKYLEKAQDEVCNVYTMMSHIQEKLLDNQ